MKRQRSLGFNIALTFMQVAYAAQPAVAAVHQKVKSKFQSEILVSKMLTHSLDFVTGCICCTASSRCPPKGKI